MIAPFVRIAHSVVYRINPVLPQAYDDSLSYFEVLARLQKKINELIDAVNALEDAVEELDTRLTTVENKIEEIIENVNSIDDRVKYLEEHPYVLPIATDTVLGGVKIGDGITRQADGTISVEGGGSPYVLPTMTEDTKGGARLGDGLVITDTDKLDVDVDNLDLSNNSSIVNIENNIDEIENNIEALDTDITNIISGDTPVPSTYELPTMDEDTKGGAILGDGLVVDDDTLSVDVDNLDLSNNETITNIIDGTTQIDISNNETIQDIISGDTPVPSSYELPTMSGSTKGGAKVGDGLSVDSNDKLNVDSSITSLPERLIEVIGYENIPGAETINLEFNPPKITQFPNNPNAFIRRIIYQDRFGEWIYADIGISAYKNDSRTQDATNEYAFNLCVIPNLEDNYSGICWLIDDPNLNHYYFTPCCAEYSLDGTLIHLYDPTTIFQATNPHSKMFFQTELYVQRLTSSKKVISIDGLIVGSGIDCYTLQDNRMKTTTDAIPFNYTINGLTPNTPYQRMEASVTNLQSTVNSRVASNVPQSEETDYPTVTEFNALLTALKNAGLMVADS